MRSKLTGPKVVSKTWWSFCKEWKGMTRQDSVLPLTKSNGSTVTSSESKIALLGELSAQRMFLVSVTTITTVSVTAAQVEKALRETDAGKPQAKIRSALFHQSRVIKANILQ